MYTLPIILYLYYEEIKIVVILYTCFSKLQQNCRGYNSVYVYDKMSSGSVN